MFSPMLEAQLPLFKITVAKLFALMTLLLVLVNNLLMSGVFYSILEGFIARSSNSNTYFVVIHFTPLYAAIFFSSLFTVIYCLFPQLKQNVGVLVFLLLSVGTCLLILTSVLSPRLIPIIFSHSKSLNILSIASLASGFIIFLGQLIYELLIKRKSHNL